MLDGVAPSFPDDFVDLADPGAPGVAQLCHQLAFEPRPKQRGNSEVTGSQVGDVEPHEVVPPKGNHEVVADAKALHTTVKTFNVEPKRFLFHDEMLTVGTEFEFPGKVKKVRHRPP